MQELSTFSEAFRKSGGNGIYPMRSSQWSPTTDQIRDLTVVHINHTLYTIQNGLRDVVHIGRCTLKKMRNLNANVLFDRWCILRPGFLRFSSHVHCPSG